MDTVMGYLGIKGKDLELLKLDTMQQTVSIKGQINSYAYIENTKNKDSSIINRLFK
jgi:sporulation protein YabP